jgi:hypothetical protein
LERPSGREPLGPQKLRLAWPGPPKAHSRELLVVPREGAKGQPPSEFGEGCLAVAAVYPSSDGLAVEDRRAALLGALEPL